MDIRIVLGFFINDSEQPSIIKMREKIYLTEGECYDIEKLIKQDLDDISLPLEVAEEKGFSPIVYKSMMLFMSFAHMHNLIGYQSKNYAYSMAKIFDYPKDAFKYLAKFMDAHQELSDTKAIATACSMRLPKASIYQSHWLDLAKYNHGENLLNPRFIRLLNHAEQIEAQLTKKYDIDEVKETEVELTASILTLENLNEHIISSPSSDSNAEQYQKNLIQLKNLYKRPAVWHSKKPFHQYSVSDIEDVFYAISAIDTARYDFAKWGLSKRDYEHFITLDTRVAGKEVPDITFNSEASKVIKLNVNDLKNAVLAYCYQVINKFDLDDISYSLTNERAGLYLLVKREANVSALQCEDILDHAWVEKLGAAQLLFKFNPKKLDTLFVFKDLAIEMIKTKDLSKVQCFVEEISKFENIGFKSEYDYGNEYLSGYSHAYNFKQKLLCDRRLPIQFTQKELKLDQAAFDEEISISKLSPTANLQYFLRWLWMNDIHQFDELFEKSKNQIVKNYYKIQENYLKELNEYSENPEKVFKKVEGIDTYLLVKTEKFYPVPALVLAAEYGDIETVKFLVANGADIHWENESYETVLMSAAGSTSANAREVVLFLLEQKANVHKESFTGKWALDFAASKGNLDVVKILIEYKAHISTDSILSDLSPLMRAVASGNAALVEYFLSVKEINIEHRNSLSETALSRAVMQPNLEMVTMLLKAGAKVNYLLWLGDASPLMHAVKIQSLPMVKAFLTYAKELDLTFENKDGHNALKYAEMHKLKNGSNKQSVEIYNIVKKAFDNASFSEHRHLVDLLADKNKPSITKIKEKIQLTSEKEKLVKKLIEADFKDIPPPVEIENYTIHAEVYKPLILFMQYEGVNENIEVYAAKMAIMFDKPEDAFNYLRLFKLMAASSKENYIEKACAMMLPSKLSYHQDWLNLFRKNYDKHLFDPWFSTLMCASSEIDMALAKNYKNSENLIGSVKEIEEELTSEINWAEKEIKKVFTNPQPDIACYAEYHSFIENLKDFRSRRALLHLKKSFAGLSLMDIEDVYYAVTDIETLKSNYAKDKLSSYDYEMFLIRDLRSKLSPAKVPDAKKNIEVMPSSPSKNGFFKHKIDVINFFSVIKKII